MVIEYLSRDSCWDSYRDGSNMVFALMMELILELPELLQIEIA